MIKAKQSLKGNISVKPARTSARGRAVFIGDSVGQGYNNANYSYIDAIRESRQFESVTKCAVGGATLGPYTTVTEAMGYSGIEQVERNEEAIAKTNHVFIQFGANDVQALMSKSVSLGSSNDASNSNTVCGYVKKLVENIYAINPKAEIRFLNLFHSDKLMEMSADAYETYFSKMYGQTFNKNEFVRWYKEWNKVIVPMFGEYEIPVIDIFEGINGNTITKSSLFTNDYIHPNNDGHKRICDKILDSMGNDDIGNYQEYKIPTFDLSAMGLPAIPVTGTEVTATGNNDEIRKAMANGLVKIKVKFNIGAEMIGHAVITPLYLPQTNEYQGVVTTVINNTPVIVGFTFTPTTMLAKANVIGG